MYTKSKIKLILPVEVKQYVSQNFNIEEYLRNYCKEKFSKNYFAQIGYFIDLLKIQKIESAKYDENDLNIINVIILADLLGYEFELNELVMGVVDTIDERGNLIIDLGFTRGYVHSSQYPDDSFKYNVEKEMLTNKDKKTIKVGDALKLKVCELGKTKYGNLNIRLTMRQPFLGKVNWL